jgi:DUF4097 and DUF4098 domain-containing protein YvlB
MRRIILTTLALLLATLILTGSTGQRSFNVSPGQKVIFNLKTGGSIHIVGWDQPSVSIDYEISGKNAEEVQVDLQQTSRGVEVNSRYTGTSSTQSSNLQLHLKVPRKFDVDIDTMGGGISISDIEGRIAGKTMGGDLTLQGLKGVVELKTMGGNITLTHSEVDGHLHTMGGKVLFEDVTGDINGSSMGGNVVYKNVRPLKKSDSVEGLDRVRSVGEEVDISTMGGDIRVEEAPEGANVKTMGGNIDIQSARHYAKAKTMGGDITIHAIEGWVNAVTMSGNVEVHMVGKGDEVKRDVMISSNSGEITLYVPGDLSMEFDISLAYTKNSRQNFQIKSDFPLQVRATDEWSQSEGTPRKYFYGTGSYLGGKHHIKITTINGNIFIKRTP